MKSTAWRDPCVHNHFWGSCVHTREQPLQQASLRFHAAPTAIYMYTQPTTSRIQHQHHGASILVHGVAKRIGGHSPHQTKSLDTRGFSVAHKVLRWCKARRCAVSLWMWELCPGTFPGKIWIPVQLAGKPHLPCGQGQQLFPKTQSQCCTCHVQITEYLIVNGSCSSPGTIYVCLTMA